MNISAAVRYLRGLCESMPIQQHAFATVLTDVLRLDQIDPVIQGNKAFKLLGHLQQFERLQQPACSPSAISSANNDNSLSSQTEVKLANPITKPITKPSALISFGGRYSNHLHALAKLGEQFEIPIIGLVQSYPDQPITPTMQDCLNWGMSLLHQTKVQYRQRYDAQHRIHIAQQYNAWVIPEGGGFDADYSAQGLDCWLPIIARYQRVWLAVGSGTTLFSLMRGLHRQSITTQLVGVNCVADQGELQRRVQEFNQSHQTQHRLIDSAHGGGFGRALPGYQQRRLKYARQDLPLEPIYFDKLLSAYLHELHTEPAASDLLIHGGGLQGDRH